MVFWSWPSTQCLCGHAEALSFSLWLFPLGQGLAKKLFRESRDQGKCQSCGLPVNTWRQLRWSSDGQERPGIHFSLGSNVLPLEGHGAGSQD